MEDAERVIRQILNERRRQISGEGWTTDHDDEHELGEMAAAAACYAAQSYNNYDFENLVLPPLNNEWPWSSDWWKPKSPRRDLIRAAALIVAEIERLDRADRAIREHTLDK